MNQNTRNHLVAGAIEVLICGGGLTILHLTNQTGTWFGYPSGIVFGNLMASVIWAVPAFVHTHLVLHHRQVNHHRIQMGELAEIRKILRMPPREEA